MIDISIVIVSYNVETLLIQCLRSVYTESAKNLNLQVIVVDNDSKDNSVNAVVAEFPQVIIIENKFNAGFSGANNQGMSISQGKFILLLNPDTEIVGQTLIDLKGYLENNSSVAIVGPKLLNSDGSLQKSAWKNHKPVDLILETFFISKLFNRLDYPLQKFSSNCQVETLSGAALFFSKDLIQKIGMLDEKLFWMEDIEFCYNAQKIGKVIYFNDSVIIHHSGQSQKKNYKISISNQLLSKLKYYRMHSFVIWAWLANITCLFFILSRIVIFGLISPFKQIWTLKAQAYAYTLGRYFKYVILNDNKIA